MTPNRLLFIARQCGIVLKAEDGNIVFRSPPGRMTPELKEKIRELKPRLIELMGNGESLKGCLGVVCQWTDFKDCSRSPVLWCHLAGGAVIGLKRCPVGHWLRDKRGMPISPKESPNRT